MWLQFAWKSDALIIIRVCRPQLTLGIAPIWSDYLLYDFVNSTIQPFSLRSANGQRVPWRLASVGMGYGMLLLGTPSWLKLHRLLVKYFCATALAPAKASWNYAQFGKQWRLHRIVSVNRQSIYLWGRGAQKAWWGGGGASTAGGTADRGAPIKHKQN